MKNNDMTGHMIAFITIIIWGTTFVSTKILLHDFTPIEILFFRFIIGFAALLIIYPQRMKVVQRNDEWLFAAAGLSGVTLYYLFENIALTYTMASNVGVICSLAPFFTAIIAYFFLKEEKLRPHFFLGFVVALTGLFLISYSGTSHFQLNPLGDILAIAATIVWAIYSVITRKISQLGYYTLLATRRIFFYGLVFMLPALFIFEFKLGLERFAVPVNLFNLLFLSLGASALCFLTWNFAVKVLGPVKTSIYIYLIPVITVITSVIVLDEKITWLAAIGAILTIGGLFLSEGNLFTKKKPAKARKKDMYYIS